MTSVASHIAVYNYINGFPNGTLFAVLCYWQGCMIPPSRGEIPHALRTFFGATKTFGFDEPYILLARKGEMRPLIEETATKYWCARGRTNDVLDQVAQIYYGVNNATNATDDAQAQPGLNLVLYEEATGERKAMYVFDTNSQGANGVSGLLRVLGSIPVGHLLVGAVQSPIGELNATVLAAINSVGVSLTASQTAIGFSLAFVGVRDGPTLPSLPAVTSILGQVSL